ncbi:MAG TPA: U32 family peptidase [Acidimicrobiales bacterium]|nr:U32 family peptidase [Acidimicrobiales bacterium]
MKLVVPAVFDDDFVDAMAALPTGHLYGAVGGDLSLRPNQWLPRPNADRLAAYVGRAREKGISFFYCLNAACLGNREFTAEGQRWIVERLGWLADIQVGGVVLSNPYLIAFARKRFPELEIAVSTAAGIDSVDKALFFEQLGAQVLYLPEYINRDFALLEQIRRRTRATLVLLANVGCLLHCSIRQYHINLVSHSNESSELGTYVDYPLMWCTCEKARDEAQMLKSVWIRPEDLRVYERMGIDEFKLAGREMDRAWVERAARAYGARRYDGDLNDIILGFDHLEPYGRLPVRISNRVLDGFIDFFAKKHDCRIGCRDCRYCDDYAAAHLRPEDDRDAFVRRLGRAIERFEAGAFRTLSGN